MKKILVVVDMQNDFISGSLGSDMAVSIVSPVAERIRSFDGQIIFTRDTHGEDYLETREGKMLPVRHCIKGTYGWQLDSAISTPDGAVVIDKPVFGSMELAELLVKMDADEKIESVELVGLCTDICVISNAMILRSALPEAEITVNSALCRGVSEQSHEAALAAMRACQITVI